MGVPASADAPLPTHDLSMLDVTFAGPTGLRRNQAALGENWKLEFTN